MIPTDLVDVRFNGAAPDTSWRDLACRRTDLLRRAHPELLVRRVSIDLGNAVAPRPGHCTVRIDATVPGHELTVSRVRAEDPLSALDRAFDGVQQQIDELEIERFGQVRPGRVG